MHALVNVLSCLAIYCELVTPRLLVCFHAGFVPYSIFIYSIFRQLTTEDREIRKIRGDQKDSSREMKRKLRLAFENLVKLKSLR